MLQQRTIKNPQNYNYKTWLKFFQKQYKKFTLYHKEYQIWSTKRKNGTKVFPFKMMALCKIKNDIKSILSILVDI